MTWAGKNRLCWTAADTLLSGLWWPDYTTVPVCSVGLFARVWIRAEIA
jgi:hypothetical protein